jgi:hypothetical protein
VNNINSASLKQAAKERQAKNTCFGNKCGHDPLNPRFYLRPLEHKPRPSVLERTLTVLQDAYFLPEKFLKALNFKGRQKRSCRREAIIAVSQVMVHYMDLATFEVGYFAGNKFIRIDLDRIVELSGLTYSRAKRALKDLVKAGYLKVTRQFVGERSITSIREILFKFFVDLKIRSLKLKKAQAWKRKKLEMETRNHTYNAPVKRPNYATVLRDKSVDLQAIGRQAVFLHSQQPDVPVSVFYKRLLDSS